MLSWGIVSRMSGLMFTRTGLSWRSRKAACAAASGRARPAEMARQYGSETSVLASGRSVPARAVDWGGSRSRAENSQTRRWSKPGSNFSSLSSLSGSAPLRAGCELGPGSSVPPARNHAPRCARDGSQHNGAEERFEPSVSLMLLSFAGTCQETQRGPGDYPLVYGALTII